MSDFCSRRKGDINELKATIWLLEQGYEVYPNAGATGITDLVCEDKEGILYKVQVKTLQKLNGSYCFRCPKHQEYYKRGIKLLWVYEDQVGWNRDYFV